MKYGPKYVAGVYLQWQDGKQVCIWPSPECSAPMKFPSFVKLPQQSAAK
jgi:hypothetical protein